MQGCWLPDHETHGPAATMNISGVNTFTCVTADHPPSLWRHVIRYLLTCKVLFWPGGSPLARPDCPADLHPLTLPRSWPTPSLGYSHHVSRSANGRLRARPLLGGTGFPIWCKSDGPCGGESPSGAGDFSAGPIRLRREFEGKGGGDELTNSSGAGRNLAGSASQGVAAGGLAG